jgi:Flp pilus assembly pilin Flp
MGHGPGMPRCNVSYLEVGRLSVLEALAVLTVLTPSPNFLQGEVKVKLNQVSTTL